MIFVLTTFGILCFHCLIMARLRQISLNPSRNPKELVHPREIAGETRSQQHDAFKQSILKSCPNGFPASVLSVVCPHPILMTQNHISDLREFHRILNLVITDIVERWWTGGSTNFPRRMPLEPYEEDILRVGRLVSKLRTLTH